MSLSDGGDDHALRYSQPRETASVVIGAQGVIIQRT